MRNNHNNTDRRLSLLEKAYREDRKRWQNLSAYIRHNEARWKKNEEENRSIREDIRSLLHAVEIQGHDLKRQGDELKRQGDRLEALLHSWHHRSEH